MIGVNLNKWLGYSLNLLAGLDKEKQRSLAYGTYEK